MIPPDHPKFQVAAESFRDITLLQFVFDHAGELVSSEEFRRKVKRVIKDSGLPQDDGSETPGRDVQFELFVGALCQASDMKPVALIEPDVQCSAMGIRFAVAAKRIKNPLQLVPRIRDAADQIAGTRLGGIIAVDTTVALNPSNNRIGNNVSDERFPRLHAAAMQRFAAEFASEIQESVRSRGVRGIVLHDHHVRYGQRGNWTLETMNYWVPTAREHARRNLEFRVFRNTYLRGLPSIATLSAA